MTVTTIPEGLHPNLRIGTIFDNNGTLAQYRGDRMVKGEPQRVYRIATSSLKVEDYGFIVGQQISSQRGGMYGWDGQASRGGGWSTYVEVVCHDWPTTEVYEDIPKPRDGKEYTWEWGRFGAEKWTQKEFPQCGECRKYHRPDYVYCESCYRCHRIGGKCK